MVVLDLDCIWGLEIWVNKYAQIFYPNQNLLLLSAVNSEADYGAENLTLEFGRTL